MSGITDDLRKAHLAGNEKYNYFLMAAAGAAIGFAVQKTEDVQLSWWLLLVAAATVCWAASFYCGCRVARSIQIALDRNIDLLEIREGAHTGQPDLAALTRPEQIRALRTGLAMLNQQANHYGKWQFLLLIAGAVCFIAWRVAAVIYQL